MPRPMLTALVLILSWVMHPLGAEAQAEAATTWAYCFSTDTRQCSLAGRHYLAGTGGAQVTPSWAQLAWQQGCEHEDGESCRELGLLHDQGRVVAQSNDRAYQLFNRGCQAGSMNSCHEQARMLRLGRGTGQNLSEANRLDTWACDHGSSAACVQMSTVFAQGAGVQRNDAESRRLLSRACELGDAAACLGSSAIEPPSGPAQTPPVQQAQGQTVTVPTAPPGYAAPSSTPGQPPAPQQHQDPVMHPTVVQTALNAVMPQFTRCYERRSRRVPMSGTVALQFRVDERGRPVDLLVHPQLTTIDDTWMRRCIQQAGGRMRFDPPPWRTSEPVIRALSFNQ